MIGQVVLHAERERRAVHHRQPPVQGLDVAQACSNFVRRRVTLRVGVVDAVDLGGHEQHLGLDLHRAQRRGGVGGEVGVAGAGGEDDDAALLEVADGAAADVRLGDCGISIAVWTRVGDADAFSSASCSASALMTVASMPM